MCCVYSAGEGCRMVPHRPQAASQWHRHQRDDPQILPQLCKLQMAATGTSTYQSTIPHFVKFVGVCMVIGLVLRQIGKYQVTYMHHCMLILSYGSDFVFHYFQSVSWVYYHNYDISSDKWYIASLFWCVHTLRFKTPYGTKSVIE